ncbi:MAG: hypothetical protein M3016_07105 [Actinomycetota bacterium]|nr:hypothetical protein [Actinomycetota bacterium]
MSWQPGRLRSGEVIAGTGAIALAACLFALPWYARSSTTVDGWNALTIARWLMVVTILVVLALVILQARMEAPALPVTLSMFGTVLGGLTSLVLIDRVLISTPFADTRAGAYLGLASSLVLTYGAGRSLRSEGPDPASNAPIPTVRLPSSS